MAKRQKSMAVDLPQETAVLDAVNDLHIVVRDMRQRGGGINPELF